MHTQLEDTDFKFVVNSLSTAGIQTNYRRHCKSRRRFCDMNIKHGFNKVK